MAEPAGPRIVILGATSAIAGALARIHAEADQARLLLAGRSARRLDEMAADLRTRGAAQVETAVLELAAAERPSDHLADFAQRLGGIDQLVIAYGLLGDQAEAGSDPQAAAEILRVNFTSAALWALAAAALLERQGHGVLVVFGSVAGDRGRRGNFVYGAAKAGLATLVEGIAHRFAGRSSHGGPRAVLLKIGPTVTPMTAHLERKGLLWAKPEEIARIAHARAKTGGSATVYAPGRWRAIMAVIRNLPAVIFNRLDI